MSPDQQPPLPPVPTNASAFPPVGDVVTQPERAARIDAALTQAMGEILTYDNTAHATDGEMAAFLTLALQKRGVTLKHVLDTWQDDLSGREDLRSELIRAHLAGECCPHPCPTCDAAGGAS